MSQKHTPIKPNHAVITHYYEERQKYADHSIDHELAVRTAFQNLLTEIGKKRGWTLIPELSDVSSGRSIRPDGTLRDKNYLPRGYWEAKDIKDDIDKAVKDKIARKYPN